MKNLNHGDLIKWRGLVGTLQAWRDTPTGLLLYCSFTIQGALRVYWLDASEVQS